MYRKEKKVHRTQTTRQASFGSVLVNAAHTCPFRGVKRYKESKNH